MEAGNAVADVLSGKVNPSAKMPFTLPVSLEQSPAHALGNYPGRDLKVNYEEDILVGYRWFDTKKIVPQFAFGYGQSYTTFELSELSTDKGTYNKDEVVHVKFNVKNSGTRFGAQVAQFYVSDPICSVMRPTKELKGFEKVFLQPGESKTVELLVKVSDLAFYDESKNGWTVEPGDFLFHLVTSSSDIGQTLKIVVQ
jgi:beta-glucosidase